MWLFFLLAYFVSPGNSHYCYRGTVECSFSCIYFCEHIIIEKKNDFEILFFNSFSCKFFEKLGPSILCSQNWFKFNTEAHCYIQITILIFLFSKFLNCSGQILSQNLLLSKLNETRHIGRYKCCMPNFFP